LRIKSLTDKYPPTRQRAELERLAKAVNASPRALRRDECGDPTIAGRWGHVIACPGIPWIEPHRPGFQMFVAPGSPRAWTAAKKALAFAAVTQDGDEEGMLFLDRLPTAAEGKTIRGYLGIRKRTEVVAAPSEAQTAARASFADRRRRKDSAHDEIGGFALREARSAQPVGQ
jgi:hypothetical protein